MDENIINMKYKKCRYKVKKWESEFIKKHDVKPSKMDIKQAPSSIKEAYRIYFMLKTRALESKLMDVTLDEDTQDCFSLLSSGNYQDSSCSFFNDISQMGDNSMFKSILDETNDMTNYSHMDDSINKTEHGNDSGLDFSNVSFTKTTVKSDDNIVLKSVDKNIVNHNPDMSGFDDSIQNKDTSETNGFEPSETIEYVNSENVWGDHVSSKTESNDKTSSKSLPKKPSMSYRFSEKMFQNFNVKLRNPRKLSKNTFKKDKSLDSKNNTTDDNISINENDYSSSIGTHTIENNIRQNEASSVDTSNVDLKSSYENDDCLLKDEPNNDESAFKILNEKAKIVIKTTPVNKISTAKNMSRSLQTLKPTITLNSFNKGWLERIDKHNKLKDNIVSKNNSDTLTDSGFESAESSYVNSVTGKSVNISDSNSDEIKPTDHVSNINTCPGIGSLSYSTNNCNVSDSDDIVCNSDDDIVCNSDDETECKSQSFLSIPSRITKRTFDTVDKTDNTIDSIDFVVKKPKLDNQLVTNENAIKSENIKVNDSCLNKDFEEKCNKLISSNSDNDFTCRTRSSNLKPNRSIVPNDSVNNVTKKQVLTQKEAEIKKKEEILRKKIVSGKANNNFVRINIQKKVYVRGKKTMTYSKFKKQQWKKKRSQLGNDNDSGGGVFKCFKCGDVGHYARYCNKGLDKLIPKEDIENEEEESPFPTLEEAEDMAKEAADSFCSKNRLMDTQDKESTDLSNDVSQFEDVPELENSDKTLTRTVPPLFKLNEENSVPDTPLIVNQALLEFGHSRFQAGQEEAIMRILSGMSTLVTLSTGSGKSLCYQLPAYMFQKFTKTPCITLVVSPLVSLMEDQVTCMVDAPIRMGCLHMNQTAKQRAAVLEELNQGQLTVLIVSPEAIVSNDSIAGSLANTLQNLPPITFVCIDEVHCISQWSHNFRPSYLVLCKVLKERFKVKTFLGLTATATKTTIGDIIEHLSLPDGLDGVISNIPLPSNLILSVSKDYDRERALVSLLQSNRFKSPFSVIIYCTRREDCEKVAMYIRTSLQNETGGGTAYKRGQLSLIAEPYHAGLTAAKRRKVQNAFMSGQLRIVVATIAFGMGINKQDVRGIIHYNMPSSFESYVQEVGRAGRDGLEANCHMFLDPRGGDLNELRRHIYANSVDRYTLRKLLQRIFVPCKCESECLKHEVAFSVEDAIKSLDIKEESISTLLCYLELYNKRWITNLPHAYTACKVQSYKGPKHLRMLARKCPPLAVAVASEIKNGAKLEKLNPLYISVIELASSMNWDSSSVKYHLKQLEWTSNINGVRCKSGLIVEFSDLGFRVKAPGNLSNEELDCTLDSLYQHVKKQEDTALLQLQMIFNTLSKITCKTVDDCMDEVDKTKSNELKNDIRTYFDKSTLESPTIPLHEEKLQNEDQIVHDIRSLVSSYKDCSFTGRSVARVFHGIASPNFPAIVMGRSRFWRAHLDQDFILLCNLASRELLRMR